MASKQKRPSQQKRNVKDNQVCDDFGLLCSNLSLIIKESSLRLLHLGTFPSQDVKKNSVNNANTVTKDFLVFSQPIIFEGALLTSAISGRRYHPHGSTTQHGRRHLVVPLL